MSDSVDSSCASGCPIDPNDPAQMAGAAPAGVFTEVDNPFVAEFEVCDLSELKNKSFLVAVATGARDAGRFLATTARGPFDFDGMVEDAGLMWEREQHHAKIVILQTDRKSEFKFVDENTTSYIETHWEKILVDNILEGVLEDTKYTCKANLLEANSQEEKKK